MSASVPTLSLPLRESSRQRAGAWALHALALVAVLALPAPPSVRVLLVAALLLLAVRSWRRRAPGLRRLDLAGGGRCTIVDARGAALEGKLGAGSILLAGLLVLDFERLGTRQGLWLARDAFAGDGFRRLRVRLRVAA